MGHDEWCLAHGCATPAAEIDHVCRAYPERNDDAFVRAHLAEWQ
jgi:hypothetical protein